MDLPSSLESPPVETLRASNGDPIATIPRPLSADELPVAPAQVTAQTASVHPTGTIPQVAGNLERFDVANHPALAEAAGLRPQSQTSSATDIVTPTTQPAYDTAISATEASVDEWPADLVHVVANGDTLEKLADRYLNDAGRALEIFDLNRDQLSNPHLLPIGVELRVPRNPNRIVD